VDGHLDPIRLGVFECDPGNSFCNRLDQIHRLGRNGGDDAFGELTVVDRASEIIGCGRGTEIKPNGEIDEEFLAIGAFVLEDTVMTEGL
jgi:hypothetical protein